MKGSICLIAFMLLAAGCEQRGARGSDPPVESGSGTIYDRGGAPDAKREQTPSANRGVTNDTRQGTGASGQIYEGSATEK